MKTTSGMRRLKTTMMVIAAMVVVVIGSAVKPVEVRAADEYTVTATPASVKVGEPISISVKEGSTDILDATLKPAASSTGEVEINGQIVKASKAGKVVISAEKESESKSGDSEPITILPKITTTESNGSIEAGENKTIITFKADGAESFTWSNTGDTLPSSINLNTSTGVLSGNPTVSDSKTYNLKIKATATVASELFASEEFAYTLTVNATAPTITTASLPVGDKGTAYSAKLEATGSKPINWSVVSGKPGWMTVGTDGTISGEPNESGIYPEKLKVKASNGTTDAEKEFEVIVNGAPAITQASLPNAAPGVYYEEIVAFTGYPAVTMTAPDLPSSLKLEIKDSKWKITGTPTDADIGSHEITFNASNTKGNATPVKLNLKIVGKPVTALSLSPTPKTIAVGETLEIKPTFTPEDASVQTLDWTSSDGNIASVDSKGVVTGKTASTTKVIITAKTTDGSNISETAEITVSADKPLITTTSLPGGTLGTEYSQTLKANIDSVTWSVTGSLPDGLKISDTSKGIISGTPTKNGEFKFTIVATSTKDKTLKDSKELSITIANVEPKIEVKGDDISGVTSSNFNDFATKQASGSEQIEVDLIVAQKSSAVADLKKKIDSLFPGFTTSNLVTKYLDIDIKSFTVNGITKTQKKDFEDTETTIEIVIALKEAVQNRNYAYVLRQHGSLNPVLKRLTTKPTSSFEEGSFFISEDGKTLYIYSRYFSSYALAYPTVNVHRVTFNTNGGSAIDEVIIQSGQYLTAPAAPSRTGYTFDGWYTDSALNNAFSFSGTRITADTTLYAKWTSANSNTETTTNTNTTPSRNGLSPANSPQTSDPIDYVRVFAALIVLGAGLIVVLGLKAKK